VSEAVQTKLRVVVHGDTPDAAWLAALRARARTVEVASAGRTAAEVLHGDTGDDTVVLVRANAPLPPFAFERIERALAAGEADVVSALTNTVAELSPVGEGVTLEADPLALDAGAWWHGARVVVPTLAWSPEFSAWRPGARRALSPTATSSLPSGCRGAVLDHLYVGDGSPTVRGPERPDDLRHAPAASPLATLRARVTPIDPRRPLYAALDRRSVVLHVLHGWGGGVEAFVRDFAETDDAAIHLALVARGHFSRRRYGEVLELLLPAAGFARVARWPLPRPIETTAIEDAGYRAVLDEIVARHGVDAVVVSSLIGHSLDALATGKPTHVVLHDYFPLWPVLHADFGDAAARFDRGSLDTALARRDATPPFAPQPAGVWWALREAWLAALARSGAALHAPSESVRRNAVRIAPALARPGIGVVEHGFRPFAGDARAAHVSPPARARPRILVLGRITGGKGETLLRDALPSLTPWADVYLLGAGAAAEGFFGTSGVHVELDYVRDRLPEAIARIAPDVALIAASVAETYSYTLSELRALGVPVVATRLGAIADRVADGVDGWLVAPEAGAIAPTLLRVLRDRAALDAVRSRLTTLEPRPLGAMSTDWRAALALAPHAGARYAPASLAPASLESADLAERAMRDAMRATELAATIEAQRAELDARADWAASLDRLARDRTRWAQELERETQRLAGMVAERQSAIEAGLAERDALILAAQAERERHDAQRIALEHEIGRAIAERDELGRQLEDLRRSYALVVNSRSWQLTKPLRWLARNARALVAALRFRTRRAIELGKRGHRSLRMRGIGGTIARAARGIAPPAAQMPALPLPAIPQPEDAADALPVVPGSEAPRVSIVIPVYNQFHYTLACLKSLAEHPGTVPFEVIVVDDRSSDVTPERLPDIAGIRALRNEENLGFIGACNAGAALARGDFVVFLNNDTSVRPGWLEALVGTFERHADCGLAGAKLVYPDGRLQEAGGIVFSDGSGWNYGRNGDPADPAYEYVREADYCSGAAIIIRRTLLEDLGGFDTRYKPAYYEDTDLAFRIREAQLKVYYQPASVVVHFEGVTSGTDTTSGIKRYQVVNQEKFVERWQHTLPRQPRPGTPIEIAREHRVRGTVLIVDAYVPEPDQDSGSVRLVNLMRLLVAAGWKVIFAPDNRAYVPKYTAELQQIGVEVLYHPTYRDPIDWLKRNGARLDAAIVLRHYIAVSYVPLFRQHAPRARVIFDTVDLHYLREQRLAELNGDAELARAAAKTKAQELKLVRECDVTLVVSPVERELLALEAPGARVDVLSNVHEINGARRPFAERRDIWFVGGFQHPPNVDAMQWFVREVWPRIAERLPGARFHIVGSKMPDAVRELASERVVAHGHVPDIAPFLDGCRISVAPLRYGAGVKGKVNQSMAHGQPVVATAIAVEGMNVEPGSDALVADTAEAFADAVVTLYHDEALWQRLSAAGVRNVERLFSFDAAREALARILPR